MSKSNRARQQRARERIEQIRAEEARRRRRRLWLICSGAAVVVIALVVGITLAVSGGGATATSSPNLAPLSSLGALGPAPAAGPQGPEQVPVPSAAALFGRTTRNQVRVLNDADAAGVAEMTFGAGIGQKGTVLMLTFGTGIGSALFTEGVLVPNTEFGHIEIRGHDAETRASERAKELHDLSWGKWAGRVDEYLKHIEALLSPNLIIVGGGISKQSEKWVPRLTGIRARVVPAALLNDAGIVGAAMATAARTGR